MMMLTFLSVIYTVLVSSFVWRVRGGALKTFLRISIGTNATRLLTTSYLALGVSLVAADWILFPVLTLSLMVGLVVAGWGPYMGMGRHSVPAASTWIDVFPKILRLSKSTKQWDFVGLTACGFILFLPMMIAAAILVNPLALAALPILSLAFAGCYALASILPLEKFPVVPGLVNCFNEARVYYHEEWAELFVGIVVGLALCLFLI